MKLSDQNSQAGFTLIEILTVIGILAILAGLGVVLSLGDYREFAFRNERNLVVSLLQKARSQAVNNVCLGGASCTDGKKHGVDFETSGQYIVFQGDSFATADTSVNQSFASNYGVTLAFSGITSSQIVFNRLSAQVTAFVTTPGKITISDSVGHTSDITINGEGQIDWTN